MSVYCLNNLSCPLDHTEKSLCTGLLASVATFKILNEKTTLTLTQTVVGTLVAYTVGGLLGHRLFRS